MLLISSIKNRINIQRVHINVFDTFPANTWQQLVNAKGVISNYAKAHNSVVKFYGLDKQATNIIPKSRDEFISNYVGMSVITKNKEKRYFVDCKNPKDFLSEVYRTLQYAIEGKPLRIVEHKDEARSRLLKLGKISG